MQIVIDNREHSLFSKCTKFISDNSEYSYLTPNIVVLPLPLGDVTINLPNTAIPNAMIPIGIFERKTFADLFASIKDGRYVEQSHRLSHSNEFTPNQVFYILEGSPATISAKDRKILYSSMTSLQFFKGFRVVMTASTSETAAFIISTADKIYRDLRKNKKLYSVIPIIPICSENLIQNIDVDTKTRDEEEPLESIVTAGTQIVLENNKTGIGYCNVVKKVKKENMTSENMGEIVLCQIPGFSAVTAQAIMKKFSGSIVNLLEELKTNPKCLENIQYETNGKLRKINKASGEIIRKYLH